MVSLSNAEARRIALAAQGIADPRLTGRVDRPVPPPPLADARAVNEHEVAAELMDELRHMASWLALDRIEVTGRGDLGPRLQQLAAGVWLPEPARRQPPPDH
jgi:uncharacterized protein YcaQ